MPSGSNGRVLVAGGGIGGLTAALCLARVGVEAVVFDKAASDEAGAGIQISPNASRVLHALGLASALQAVALQPDGIEFRHWRSGKVVGTAALGKAALAAYGFPYYHVHRGDLRAILVAAAEREPGVALHAAAEVRGLKQAGQRVCVAVRACGRETWHDGVALIGADGIRSTVRAALFGTAPPTFAGHVAWRALVPAERLPRGAVRPVATVWWGPRRHFVSYPVRAGALVNCVCVVEKAGWQVESWTARGERRELAADFAGWHADVQRLIDHMAADALYKWAIFHRPPARRWSRGVVTLLGDAAHPMQPFMAQGAAMAIEDAAVLAACLADGGDVPAALQRYESARRARTAKVQRQTRRNATVFHLSGIAAWLRDRAAGPLAAAAMARVYGDDAMLRVGQRGAGGEPFTAWLRARPPASVPSRAASAAGRNRS